MTKERCETLHKPGKPYRERLHFNGGHVDRGHSLTTHPMDGMTAHVDCGDGAAMSIKDPTPETGLVWTLTWGDADSARYCAASLLESYDYLLCGQITEAEAGRRLTLLRRARKALVASGPLPRRDREPQP